MVVRTGASEAIETTFAVSFALAVMAVGIPAGPPIAKIRSQVVYEACEPDRGKIDAASLPDVLNQDLCQLWAVRLWTMGPRR